MILKHIQYSIRLAPYLPPRSEQEPLVTAESTAVQPGLLALMKT